ncbi:MAG: hypothetical protein KDC84_11065 [Crocinitomicaceae bacterium]|nr:hypothetical protein [Crocinitomicaceae bacterium]
MKSIKLMTVVFGLVLLATSCNKLTEKNIIGTWNMTAASYNGISQDPPSFTWVVVFNEGNTGTSTLNGNTSTMVWVLDEKNQTITIPNTLGNSQLYTVVEKKGDVLKVKYENNGTYEYTFEKQ